MNEPEFLRRPVSDDDLAADLDALLAGRYPQWSFAGDSAWSSTQAEGGKLVLGRFWSIWLKDLAGEQVTFTLRRQPDLALWRRSELNEPGRLRRSE
jgi:hypothetical protein